MKLRLHHFFLNKSLLTTTSTINPTIIAKSDPGVICSTACMLNGFDDQVMIGVNANVSSYA